MENKTKWNIGFLGVTAIAVILEFWAVFDNNINTSPWTTLIINNIPQWAFFSFLGAFAFWVFGHFAKGFNKPK